MLGHSDGQGVAAGFWVAGKARGAVAAIKRCAADVGEHAAVGAGGLAVSGLRPHWLAIPEPPQTSGAVQLPQSRMLPQPSASFPHWALTLAQVLGVQVTPSSLQLAGPAPMHTLAPL